MLPTSLFFTFIVTQGRISKRWMVHCHLSKTIFQPDERKVVHH
jgi:hypothetical protein